MRQPIRKSPARACPALVESRGCFSGGNESDVHWAGDRFSVLQTIGDQPKRKRLDVRSRLLSGAPIGGESGKGWDVSQPTAISLPVALRNVQIIPPDLSPGKMIERTRATR